MGSGVRVPSPAPTVPPENTIECVFATNMRVYERGCRLENVRKQKMISSQKPETTSLSLLLKLLEEGRYGIPDFQREFKWKPQHINDLMKSIFSDYYIGTLLLWRATRENLQHLNCQDIYGYSNTVPQKYNDHIVLDGQQRLTAIYYSFMAPDIHLPGRSKRAIFHISIDKFLEKDSENAFGYTWISKRNETLMDSLEEQFELGLFPLKVLTENELDNGFVNWVNKYRGFWEKRLEQTEDEKAMATIQKRIDNAQKFFDRIRETVSHYKISYIELSQDIELEKVCDIFTQINSKGVRLDVFDLLNALMNPKEVKLKEWYLSAKEQFSFLDTSKMNIYILQVMSLVKQGYCKPQHLYNLTPGVSKLSRQEDGSIRPVVTIPDKEKFRESWDSSISSLSDAMEMLKRSDGFGVLNKNLLPYTTIIVPLAALNDAIGKLENSSKFSAQRKLELWYWSSVFQSRYAGSIESTAAQDYKAVQEWFISDEAVPDVVEDFRVSYKSLSLIRETEKRSAVYRAVMNMLVKSGAKDWYTGNAFTRNDVDGHHIVPRSWGLKNNLKEITDSVLNKTLLTSTTNRIIIGDRLPNEYLLEMLSNSEEKGVRRVLRSHFINDQSIAILCRNPFTRDDFEEFLKERQNSLIEGVESMILEERPSSNPVNEDLWDKICQIEMLLRKEIISSLQNKKDLLPHDIVEKCQKNIDQDIKKLPSLNDGRFDRIEGVIEYFNLRQLQDTITSRALWSYFENRFKSKERLIRRFDQLNDLRNCLAHNRPLNVVVAKDGEASIHWFENELGQKS